MGTKRIKALFESKVFFYYPRVSVRELFIHTGPRFVVTYNWNFFRNKVQELQKILRRCLSQVCNCKLN